MEIDVHHVEAHIARAAGTEHRIEVGPVVVHQTTTTMDEFCDLRDMFLEESEGIGIGHHHGGDVGAFLTDQSFQVGYINESSRIRLHLEDLEATDGGRSGVRAMGGVGHDDFLPLEVAPRTMIVVDGHQARQLTMGTGVGLGR